MKPTNPEAEWYFIRKINLIVDCLNNINNILASNHITLSGTASNLYILKDDCEYPTLRSFLEELRESKMEELAFNRTKLRELNNETNP